MDISALLILLTVTWDFTVWMHHIVLNLPGRAKCWVAFRFCCYYRCCSGQPETYMCACVKWNGRLTVNAYCKLSYRLQVSLQKGCWISVSIQKVRGLFQTPSPTLATISPLTFSFLSPIALNFHFLHHFLWALFKYCFLKTFLFLLDLPIHVLCPSFYRSFASTFLYL